MGIIKKIFRKSHEKKSTSDFSKRANELGGVYKIINILWGEESFKKVVAHLKECIQGMIENECIDRKNELLKFAIGDCFRYFKDDSPKEQLEFTANALNSFITYRIFFECVLAMDTDIAHISEHYLLFQISGRIPDGMHPYVSTMIKIYDILDTTILFLFEKSNSNSNITREFIMDTLNTIFDYLDSYVDDSTDWNKIG
ncbi:MAG: hypothetical protein IJF73_05420 [Clostridia bacterium]|nr:hypothetical protein [Clostridia bacterium]